FRAASPRFRFSCSTPKLQITDVSEVTLEGAFKVYVRNAKAVKASHPLVTYRPLEGGEVRLTGPDSIEPFGVAEFVFQARTDVIPKAPVTLAQLDITCANCP